MKNENIFSKKKKTTRKHQSSVCKTRPALRTLQYSAKYYKYCDSTCRTVTWSILDLDLLSSCLDCDEMNECHRVPAQHHCNKTLSPSPIRSTESHRVSRPGGHRSVLLWNECFQGCKNWNVCDIGCSFSGTCFVSVLFLRCCSGETNSAKMISRIFVVVENNVLVLFAFFKLIIVGCWIFFV